MENSIKISIITICYNSSKTIERTILSVLGQTYQNYEYIVIDGGSTDGTVDILRKYSRKINWISEPDNGIYDAMNKGIRISKGEWLNFMNAGDRFASNDVLEKIFCYEYPEDIKFLYSDTYFENKNLQRTFAPHDHNIMRINHQSSIYKKELHYEHGFYVVTPKIIISDLLFFLQVPKECFRKVNTIISINETDGVSSGVWCLEQAVCAKVVFRQYSFTQMLLHYVSARIKRLLHII